MSEKSIAQRNKEIKMKLREKGYANKVIDYQEFQELYEPYKKEMSEIDFAGVIGISVNNYSNIKNAGQKTRILKFTDVSREKNITKRNEEIERELRERGYANKSIDYQEFQELYEPYKKEMSEIDFAGVIGITNGNYNKLKNHTQKTRILKLTNIPQEKKEEIKNNIKHNVDINQLIDYEEFLELYEPYKKEMSEIDFAEVIGISASKYKNIKYQGKKTRVLKTEEITEERKEEIVNELKEKGYANKSIAYQEFLELYESQKKEMSEIDFAGVIGISYGSYQTIKHTDRRAKILKTENIQEEITEERKVEIVNELKEKGYTNKLINYPEFLELYELYKQEIKENQMAEIIGISEVSYSHIKYEGKNTRILKTGKIPEERKEEIVGELKQKGYAYKSIMYQEFLELYEPYKKEMQEQDFASIIIRTYSSYNNMKYRGAKVRILKINYVSKERKVEIINELKGKGNENKSITYQEFLQLYEPYKPDMREQEFAVLIGINYGSYRNMKYEGKNAKILKIKSISYKRKEAIQNKLKEKGYTNKSITYQEFQELYEPYKKEMSELEFADIIGISNISYNMLKNQGKNAKILKSEKVLEKRKEEIVKELKKKGYVNKLISYQEFLQLYEPYKQEMKEKDFVEILGVSYGCYQIMRRQGTNTKILKTKNVSKERKEEIIKELKEEGYANRAISYQEFLELYEPYKKEMSESNFASVIGITYSSLMTIKSRNSNAIMLKTEKITEERKEEIINKLNEKGYVNKSISYQEFLELYEPYKKEMKEKEFALIIGISSNSHSSIKYRGANTKILKTQIVLEKRKEEIVKELKEKGYANRLITYEEFLQLYESYKQEMTEQNFANIVGISASNYNNIKNKGTRGKVKFNRLALERIKYQLSENRYYTKEELEKTCEQYGVKVVELLASIFGGERYTESLMQKDSIYIGRCKIPKEFQQKYAKNLLDNAQKISRVLTNKYNLKSYCDDFASDVVMYVIKNRGDIVKNYTADSEALENLYAYMNGIIERKCFQKLKIKNISLDEDIGSNRRFSKTERYALVKDKSVHFWEDIEEKESQIPDNKKIVMLMRECYDQGMNNVEAIKCITERYGISKEELLKILEQELTKRRKVVKTADGKVYLGEEVE